MAKTMYIRENDDSSTHRPLALAQTRPLAKCRAHAATRPRAPAARTTLGFVVLAIVIRIVATARRRRLDVADRARWLLDIAIDIAVDIAVIDRGFIGRIVVDIAMGASLDEKVMIVARRHRREDLEGIVFGRGTRRRGCPVRLGALHDFFGSIRLFWV